MKILIVDDHAVVRQGYTALLSAMLAPCEVFEASSGPEALKCCKDQSLDVIVMDINMPDQSGLEALRAIRSECGEIPALFFSMYEELPVLHQALKSGAKGYITKSCPPDILVEAVRAVASGQVYIQKEIAEKIAVSRPESLESTLNNMSQRESEIFIMLAKGMSHKAIANQLSITNKTVANYVAILKGKLGISSSAEFVYLAIEKGVIKI